MKQGGLDNMVVAQMEPGDIDENEAASVVAAALSAPGIEMHPAATGRVNLHAMTGGLHRRSCSR